MSNQSQKVLKKKKIEQVPFLSYRFHKKAKWTNSVAIWCTFHTEFIKSRKRKERRIYHYTTCGSEKSSEGAQKFPFLMESCFLLACWLTAPKIVHFVFFFLFLLFWVERVHQRPLNKSTQADHSSTKTKTEVGGNWKIQDNQEEPI